MRTLSVIVLLLFSSVTGVVAQQILHDSLPPVSAVPLEVDTVLILGNTSTKEYVIEREMSLRPGTPITREALEYEQNRLYSLGLFTRVQLHVVPTIPGKATLIVEVNERWYIFPFPVFGLRDRDWKKAYYGAGILHSNFRGRNEKLFGMLVLGYDPAAEISYRNPLLSLDGGYLGELRLLYQKVTNRSIQARTNTDNFQERHFSSSLSIGKRFGLHHTVWTTVGFEVVKVSEYQPGRTISPSGKDQYPFFSLSYTYDTRDLYEYPSRGILVKLSARKYGLPSADLDIVRYASDLRLYVPLLPMVVFTGRVFNDMVAGGPTPTYNRVYLGYGERIRGHFKEVREGEHLVGVSTELHYPILPPIYVNLSFLPAEFSLLKFGIVAAVFADAGTVWFRHSPLSLTTFTKGYGVGIHFLLPYSMVLRTDYARNEYRRGEFILDLGTSF